MGKHNLSEAAKMILGEDSKSTFDANIASKKAQRGSDKHPKGEVGDEKLPTSTVTGQEDAGKIGDSPDKTSGEALPDYTKGTPSATPPGATPPVSSQPDGVGAAKPQGQPQETIPGQTATQSSPTSYDAIRDRIAGKLAPQMMQKNPGATFASYGESLDVTDDVNALLEGESLSEEFKSKATTIFEAAVMTRVQSIAEEIETHLQEEFVLAVEQVKEDLESKVDDYLNYMVEEWMKDNEIAIEKGLRAEIVENFIDSLRDLFVEHYIDIPADKVDVVEELTAKLEESEAALNEQISRGVEMAKQINEQKKIEAVYTACEGLSQTQVEKLKALAENVEFTTEAEFVAKLETLKESYFKTEVKAATSNALDEEVIIEEDKKEVRSIDPSMDIYVKSISQSVNK